MLCKTSYVASGISPTVATVYQSFTTDRTKLCLSVCLSSVSLLQLARSGSKIYKQKDKASATVLTRVKDTLIFIISLSTLLQISYLFNRRL